MDRVAPPPVSKSAYGWAIGACAAVALLAILLRPYLDLANIVMLFLLAVLGVAVRGGRGPAVLASFLSVALFDFFIVPPRLSLAVADVQYLITFAVMLAVALTISHLTAGLRQQAEIASQKEQQARLLYELARELAGALAVAQVAAAVQRFLRGMDLAAVLLLPDAAEQLQTVAADEAAALRLDEALAAAAFRQGEAMELDHLAALGYAALYLPLKAPMRVRGVLALAPGDGRGARLHERRTLLMTAASLVAIALERMHYAEVAQVTQVQIVSERLRSSILSALSHDIRTPLAVLVGLADTLVVVRPPLPAVAQETAEAIRDQAIQLNRLVENLLDMARLNAGSVQLRKEWHLLEEVVGSSLKLMQPALAQHELRVQLPRELPLVEYDAVLLERVLCNLLENAAKYAPPDTPIEIAAAQDGDWVVVEVKDRGPGLPPEKQAALFEMFVRGDLESSTPGVGLGLAICKTIVEAHGGRIAADNRPEGGACLRFRLPLGTPPALDDEALVLARERRP